MFRSTHCFQSLFHCAVCLLGEDFEGVPPLLGVRAFFGGEGVVGPGSSSESDSTICRLLRGVIEDVEAGCGLAFARDAGVFGLLDRLLVDTVSGSKSSSESDWPI